MDYKLIPYFQPIVSLTSKKIFGFEVLARGLAPKGDIILPKELFKGDEQSCLMISRKVRELAFEKFTGLKNHHSIFVNVLPSHFLSIRNLKRDSHIWKFCEHYEIDPRSVILELTESASEQFERVVSILKEYARLGFRIAIDDWGAGHSNFDRLNILEPSLVKVDAAFLWRATTDPAVAEAFCMAVSTISGMGVQVVIEGVEKVEHLYMAMEGGCALIQGFYLARPAPEFLADDACVETLESAFSIYRESKLCHLKNQKIKINSYVKQIRDEFEILADRKVILENLMRRLKELMERDSEVIKIYVLDGQNGIQISPNLVRQNDLIAEDPSKKGYDWSWRPYYLKFKVNQELFGTSYSVIGPYLDPEIGYQLYTLVMAIGKYIACIDFSSEI